MLTRALIVFVFLAAAIVMSPAAMAGGWATVSVDEGRLEAVMGQPWQASVVVKQHGVTPIDVDVLSLHFVSQANGTTMDAKGTSTGETGHYLVDVTFAESGLWNWTATPAPFGPMSMATITVRETAAELGPGPPRATFVTGTCEDPGAELFNLPLDSSNAALATAIAPAIGPVVDRALVDPVVVSIWDSSAERKLLACAELPRKGVAEPLMLVLQPQNGSMVTGTLSLVPSNGDVAATLVVISQSANSGVTIHIKEQSGDWMFAPQAITIPVGTTVTWVNETDMAHTVSGSASGFVNSGVLEPGASFSQTFSTAGEYPFVCDPHPWMTGAVTVVD